MVLHVSLTDEIRQIAINLADRLHRLEVLERKPPLSFEYAGDGTTFQPLLTTGTPVPGAEAILEPGVYIVQGHFDIRAASAAGDEAELASGRLVLNRQMLPGAAVMALLSVLGTDSVTRRGVRSTVTMSWVLSLWDYAQAVLLDNPVIFYRLADDASKGTASLGFVRDSSITSRPGLSTGGARLRVGPLKRGIDNVPSYSTLLNGTAEYIQGALQTFSSASGSLEIWFKTSASGSIQSLMANSNLATHRDGAALYMNAAGNLVLEVASGAAATAITSATAFNDDAWHHAVGTFDGTTLRLYVDGTLNTSGAQGGVVPTMPSNDAMWIGSEDSATAYFNGYVAEPAYYSAVVLRPNRVLLHYQIGATEYLPTTYYKAAVLADTPLRYFRLDESSGSVMEDSSGNNQNGTYTRITLIQPGGIMADPDGTYNTSTKFDSYFGAPSSASAPDTGLPSSNADRTLEAWIYITEAPGGAVTAVIAGYGTAGVAEQAWYLAVRSTLLLRFSTDGGNIDGTTVLQLSRWYHVAVKNVGNNYTIYLDGDVEATGTLTTNTVLAGLFYVGNFSVANRDFTGLIDEVSLTAGALSDARVSERYRTGRSNRAFIQLAAYKSGGTGLSDVFYGNTKLVVTKLQSLAKS